MIPTKPVAIRVTPRINTLFPEAEALEEKRCCDQNENGREDVHGLTIQGFAGFVKPVGPGPHHASPGPCGMAPGEYGAAHVLSADLTLYSTSISPK